MNHTILLLSSERSKRLLRIIRIIIRIIIIIIIIIIIRIIRIGHKFFNGNKFPNTTVGLDKLC